MPEEVVRNTFFSGGIAMKYQFIHSFIICWLVPEIVLHVTKWRHELMTWRHDVISWHYFQPQQGMNEWTDTSLRYRHWRMCFERLLQAFARWQPGILFDIAAQPILEYHWIDSYSQTSLRTQFKVAVYSIHTQSLSWCSTGLVPNVLPRRDEGSGKPCAVDRAS